jgi:hypothetical protein
VLFESILLRLGGHEMLELMIQASDFEPIYYNKEGLRFTFGALGSSKLRRASFFPMVISNQSMSFYSAPKYQLRLVVETVDGSSFELEKPYHNVTLSNPSTLARTFETVAKVAVGF